MKRKQAKRLTCGDCKLKWQDDKPINRDLNGNYFAWRCQFDPYIRLAEWPACSHIKVD